MLLLDLVWIGLVARRLYAPMVRTIQQTDMAVRVVPAVLAYVCLVAGLVVFCLDADPTRAAVRGAAFGGITYGVYAFTCASVLRDFRLAVAAADVAWGACLFACASALAALL